MPKRFSSTLSRRRFLASTVAAASAAILPIHRPPPAQAKALRTFRLRAAPGPVRLVPEPYAETPAWCYNASVPGPEIRLNQGDRLRITVDNGLGEETTVHWHGLRIPNAMDGVPHLTQTPIGPGESFVYEFDAVDAGTFWYHPHQRSFEQVGRGLYGPLIVAEAEPIRVDRDLTWVLDDWRLTNTAEISDDFGSRRDVSHNGRVGNTVTVNGAVPDSFAVRGGERLRLRLINAANARIFSLDFADHKPVIIAFDGQPTVPHAPAGGLVVLGPAMRVDLIVDMTGAAGRRASVIDRFNQRLAYRLIDLVYADRPLRDQPPDWPMTLPANPLPKPDLAEAIRHDVVFNGGMMGAGLMMANKAAMMEMMHAGKIWFINGVAAEGPVMEPMLTLKQDRSHVIAMANQTAWHHPMHLHGHSFRVISRNGQPTRHGEWQDTVLMSPRERVEIAFVADNPGDWMFHCHILEHQAAGMMGVIRVGNG